MSKIKETTLKNGLKIISYQNNNNPIVSIQLYIRMGSAFEKDNESGFSHLTEHMVFRSTKGYPDSSIMEKSAEIGGAINAYTEFDSTCFYITLPSWNIDEGLKIISDLGMNANFSDEEFYTEKDVVIQEKSQYEDDPEDTFIEQIAADYFTKNRYKNPILGKIEILQNAKPDDLRHFYDKYYRPNNAFLLVTGDINHSKLTKQVAKYFEKWEEKEIDKIPCFDDEAKQGFGFFKKDIQDNYLAFVFPELKEDSLHSYPLAAAMNMFAMGKKSRLYKRLFLKEQLIDGIKTHSLCGLNNGVTIIMIIPKTGVELSKIIEIFYEEQSKMLRFGFDKEELEKYKKEQINNYKYSYEYMESLGMSIAMEELLSSYKKFLTYPQIIKNVAMSDVEASYKKYLTKDKLFIYQMGKKKTDYNFDKKAALIKSAKILSTDIWETQIANGMKIVLKKSQDNPIVGIALALPISQLNETAGKRGVNIFTSTQLLYGNKKMNYEQFMDYCSSQGIAFSVSNRIDASIFKIKCFKDDIKIALRLLYDVVFTAIFPEDHFENMKKTYLSMLKKMKNYPQYYSQRLWKESFFGRNSNLVNAEGNLSDIKNMKLNKLKAWHKNYYSTGNMNLALVGDFDFEEIFDFIEELFSTQIDRGEEALPKVVFNPPKILTKSKQMNLKQAYIMMGGKGISFKDKNHTAFFVLSQIIGGNADPILFDELREKRSLAYSVDFDYAITNHFGYFSAYAIVENRYYRQAINLAKKVLTKMLTPDAIEERLPTVIKYVKAQKILGEESVLSQAVSLSYILSIGKNHQYSLDWEKRIDAVDTDKIMDIVETYFKKENLFTYILR